MSAFQSKAGNLQHWIGPDPISLYSASSLQRRFPIRLVKSMSTKMADPQGLNRGTEMIELLSGASLQEFSDPFPALPKVIIVSGGLASWHSESLLLTLEMTKPCFSIIEGSGSGNSKGGRAGGIEEVTCYFRMPALVLVFVTSSAQLPLTRRRTSLLWLQPISRAPFPPSTPSRAHFRLFPSASRSRRAPT